MSYKYSNMVPKNPHCTQVFIISLFITGKWGRSQLGNAWTVAYLYNKDSVQSLSRVWLLATPWTAARQASLSITNSWSQTHVQNKDCLALKRRELLIKTTHIILRERRLKRLYTVWSHLWKFWKKQNWKWRRKISSCEELEGGLGTKSQQEGCWER